MNRPLPLAAVIALLLTTHATTFAQGTAFTGQERLNSTGAFIGNGSMLSNVPAATLSNQFANRINWQRLASSLENNNPFTKNALTPLPGWQPSTYYLAGTVVTDSAGNAYLCEITGTSAASGGPTTNGFGVQTDGSVTWLPTTIYPADNLNYSETNVPAVPSGLTKFWSITNKFSIYGGNLSNYSGNANARYIQPLTNTANFQPSIISFNTTATHFCLSCYDSTPVQVLINGRLFNQSGLVCSNSYGNGGIGSLFSFTCPDRSAKHVEILTYGSAAWKGVYTSPIDPVWTDPQDDRPLWVAVGDSITHGAFIQLPVNMWPVRLGEMLGWNVWDAGISGTGYTNYAVTYTTYAQRIPQLPSPGLVSGLIIYGCSNDGSVTNGFAAAVTSTYNAYRAAYPTQYLVFMGAYASATGPSLLFTNKEQIISNCVASFNDPLCFYIPVVLDPSPWFFGTGISSSPNGTGNTDWAVGTTTSVVDTFHPNDNGGAYQGTRFYNAFLNWLMGGIK